ncbi:hypothetical protein LR48_Vigan11g095200 [Vigna angularis]|uniref:Uncharacterized protein n=1 Tax=Phaseolus angularis TaxID=3914 RepID=A0A0L9VT32_PHAAN|nr:hypothetical protein LR48_Vigan11g095200 [Vigna angularis]
MNGVVVAMDSSITEKVDNLEDWRLTNEFRVQVLGLRVLPTQMAHFRRMEEPLDESINRLSFSSQAKETLSVELVKYCYGDRGIAGSSLVHLRKCLEVEVILREVFGGSVSSFVKTQMTCFFISCGIKRGVF